MNGQTPETEKHREELERRERLSALESANRETYTQTYTVFIRRMRLFLPLVAIALIAALLTWPKEKETFVPTPKEQQEAYKSVKKNELVNPRFESVDEENRPYTVTADKATQSENDNDMLILDKPVADMMLKSKNWVALKARSGFYRQKERKLFLKGDVHLFHDEGYEARTDELHADMTAGTAWSETDIQGNGPKGALEAKGMRADRTANTIIFTGPARLTLKDIRAIGGLAETNDTHVQANDERTGKDE